MKKSYFSIIAVTLLSLLAIPAVVSSTDAQSVPDWIKNTALWYGEGEITETEFLNAIKFLIENDIIVIEIVEPEPDPQPKTMNVIIPNGNSDMGNAGLFIPLNAQVSVGTTVVWINDDAVPHTIQSQDEQGNVIGLFNSGILNTGDRFPHTFDESGVYNYFCTLHPWRVGLVTVT